MSTHTTSEDPGAILESVPGEILVQIAQRVYPEATVSYGSPFKHGDYFTAMLNGITSFDPLSNRRHAWEVMIAFDLYVKSFTNGWYEAGSHDPEKTRVVIEETPMTAIVVAATMVLSRDNDAS